MAAIGLSLFNFIIVLGPLFAIIAFIFSFWVGGIASVVTPFFVIGKVFMGTFIWLDLFVSITFIGVGLLLCIIAYYSTKWFKRLCVRYVIWNFKMIKGVDDEKILLVAIACIIIGVIGISQTYEKAVQTAEKGNKEDIIKMKH